MRRKQKKQADGLKDSGNACDESGSEQLAEVVDLRSKPFSELQTALLQAAERREDDKQVLEAQVSSISWPALAALKATGFTYTIIDKDPVRLRVSRCCNEKERTKRLKERLRPREFIVRR